MSEPMTSWIRRTTRKSPGRSRLLLSTAVDCLVPLFAAPAPCRADFIASYQTAQGAVNPTDGQPVDTLVTFEANGTTLTITLANLQADPKAVSQNLSDLFFTFTTGEDVPRDPGTPVPEPGSLLLLGTGLGALGLAVWHKKK